MTKLTEDECENVTVLVQALINSKQCKCVDGTPEVTVQHVGGVPDSKVTFFVIFSSLYKLFSSWCDD